jgi:hypothetical protein
MQHYNRRAYVCQMTSHHNRARRATLNTKSVMIAFNNYPDSQSWQASASLPAMSTPEEIQAIAEAKKG